ncbi:hypothetical protein [EBPR siphovirus 2]|nr:hypothetical protein [EBPR siphovirus 2]
MVGILNRVAHLVTTTGTGSVTPGTVINTKLLSAAEAGAVNGQQYYFVLEDGNDSELFIGTYSSAGPSISRDTVLVSKIGGTAGTTKLNLSGNAALRSAAPAEAFVFALTLGALTDVASGSTTNIGAAATANVRVTGTTTITAFDTAAAGLPRFVRFNGALTLTHNGTSLILPGGANIVTTAGDTALFVSEGSGNWRCHAYQRADGTPLAVPAAKDPTGKQSIWIPAGAMTTRTTNGAAAGTAETTTNKVMIKTLDFDASTQEFAQFSIRMPKSWNEGTVTFAPVWSHASTSTNFGVVWQLAGLALSNDDAMDAAFGTERTSTDTGGTTNDLYEGPESSAITIAGSPAEGDTVIFQVARAPANGSDTMAIDARLHGIVLYITTTAGNDA